MWRLLKACTRKDPRYKWKTICCCFPLQFSVGEQSRKYAGSGSLYAVVFHFSFLLEKQSTKDAGLIVISNFRFIHIEECCSRHMNLAFDERDRSFFGTGVKC